MITEEKITLDRETFKTLASDTRVEILKSIHRRRKTLTELSRQFNMSPSTIKEHLDSLSKAGLVLQKDEGHKWKYYELTDKGKNIVVPSDTKIWVVLGVSILGILLTVFEIFNSFQPPILASREMTQTASKSFPAPEAGGAGGAAMPSIPLTDVGSTEFSQIVPLPYFHIAMLVIFLVILGISGAIMVKSRKSR